MTVISWPAQIAGPAEHSSHTLRHQVELAVDHVFIGLCSNRKAEVSAALADRAVWVGHELHSLLVRGI